ncbi:hypothetical protein quinque_011911 [Culex quinquefasciatus]
MKIPLLILLCSIAQISAKGMTPSDLTININDILNEQLMPATFLMLEGPPDLGLRTEDELMEPDGMESRTADPEDGSGQIKSTERGTTALLHNLTREDGTFRTAFSTMGFHRKMMNNYRCNGFLANQIIADVLPLRELSLSRRVGTAPGSFMMLENNSLPTPSKDTMLYDQGSSGYVNWLSKSSTLDDIYRNYLAPGGPMAVMNVSNHRSDITPVSNPRSAEEEYFDEGMITGYAVQQQPDPNHVAFPKPAYQPNPYHHHHHQQPAQNQHPYRPPAQQYPPLAGGRVYNHGEPPYSDASRGDYAYHPIEIEEKSIKGLGLKDLFDIALTTLAFLSFGMFVLQVIMCITMTKSDANMMMIPTVNPDDGEEEVRRRRRRRRGAVPPVETLELVRLREINQIAARVLDSMDAVAVTGKDEGSCVQRTICDINQYSLQLKYNRKYWIGVWSLGVTWLAGAMAETEESSGTILTCLKAIIIGLGSGDCNRAYSCSKYRKINKA